MKGWRFAMVLGGIGAALSGCGSLHSGLAEILIDTNPSGAACMLSRLEEPIAAVNPTPGIVNLDPAATTGLSVSCRRPGYAEATVPVPPSVMTGGWGGSYPEPQQVNIALVPAARAGVAR